MESSVGAIPLDGDAWDERGLGMAVVGPKARPDASPSLATQQLGLLASPKSAPGVDRRIEDWIVSQIDLALEAEPCPRPRTVWDQLIDRLPGARPASGGAPARGGPETAFANWSRFRVSYRRGITLVRLVDRALVKERHVRELTRDLIELIDAGNRRVILNFQGVDKVGSWVALAVDEIYRRARAADGGDLKVCGLSDHLAAVLDIAGMAPGIELYPDENSALGARWPESSAPRTLPVEILLALASVPELPPIRGGAPIPPSSVSQVGDGTSSQRPRRGKPAMPAAETGLWLIVQIGAGKGRTVAVDGPRFLIGRRGDCQLRLGLPMVSKVHAAIERREGRIILTDMGSTNGTVLNGRLLRGKEAEVHDGDRFQVGPVICTVATVAHRGGPAKVEERVAEWLHGEEVPVSDAMGQGPDTAVFVTPGLPGGESAEWAVRTEIIQDVLVVTPETGELENESTIERLREHLNSLLGEAVPRRVVINLEYVAYLTGRAIGVLLAHHLALGRAGGCLRIGQARARIMAVLHQVRLTMLIECHPTLDEAVLSAWPDAGSRIPVGD